MSDVESGGPGGEVVHPPADPAAVDAAAALVAAARQIAVLAGAGISTDSGIPDFRGPQGLWTKDPDAEKASHISAYVSDPDLRARSWQRRLALSEQPPWQPNAGHRALVELERQGRLHTLVTQNIDGLHHAAGHDPALIVEVHGNVRQVKCLDCGERAPMERALARVAAGEADPPCRTCGGLLKSATVSFGEGLDHHDIDRAQQAAFECDLLLAVGSTLGVYPVAGMVPLAKRAGAKVVIVNGGPTEMDGLADVLVLGSLSETLPRIVGWEAS